MNTREPESGAERSPASAGGAAPVALQGQPCMELRCKEMYHDSSDDDSFSSNLFWCNQTQDCKGPDGQPVGKFECCAGRRCYVDFNVPANPGSNSIT